MVVGLRGLAHHCRSNHIQHEIERVFSAPRDKIVVSTGSMQRNSILKVEPGFKESMLSITRNCVFVGRLVRKRVHVLIDSAPAILRACPEAKFVLREGTDGGELSTGHGSPVWKNLFHRLYDDVEQTL